MPYLQRVKNSSVTSTYAYNTPNKQPYSEFFSQQHYATNNYPHSPSSISYQRPLSHMLQFNITPHQYTSQNVPKNIISSTITSPPSVNDELSNFSQPSPSEMYSTQKPNY